LRFFFIDISAVRAWPNEDALAQIFVFSRYRVAQLLPPYVHGDNCILCKDHHFQERYAVPGWMTLAVRLAIN